MCRVWFKISVLVLVCSAWIFGLAGTSTAKPGGVPKPSVVKLFRDAQQLFKAERYPEARVAFERLIRIYPTHEPSLILYARTQYKLNNLPEAYKAFSKINLASLDPETSYEYGQTYFQGNQFEGALAAFKRIPEGNSLSDLANYYGAVSAAKLRRYQESEEMLEKALVLPDKLAKSRALYMKHVQEMRLLGEKQNLQRERLEERRRIAEQRRLANREVNTEPPKVEPPKADGPYIHKGTQSVVREGRLSYENIRQTADFNGFGDADTTIDDAKFTFSHGPIFPLPVKVEDRQAAIGMQLALRAEDRKTTGVERRFVSESTQGDLIRILTKPEDDLHVKQGEVELTPWIEFPLPFHNWLALSGDLDLVFPDYDSGGRTGSRGGTLLESGTKDIFTFTLSGTYTQFLDNNSQPGSTMSRVKGELLFAWPEGTSLAMEARHDEYDYFDQTLDGPDASTLGKGTLSQTFPMGFKLSAAGTYELQENVFFHAIPERSVVRADGTVFTGKAALTFDPVPWISVGVSQTFSQTKWSVATPEDVDIFDRNVPNYISETSVIGAIVMPL